MRAERRGGHARLASAALGAEQASGDQQTYVSAPRSLSDLESRGGGVAGMTLIGSTVRGQLHCLDPLRKLEEKYWRILEKVQIGGEPATPRKGSTACTATV